MKWTGLGVFALAAVLTVGCERNAASDRDDRDSVGTSGVAGDRDDDRDFTLGIGGIRDSRQFVSEVSMTNHAEVEMAQLAAQRAQSSDVKQFAQMMIRDHTKAANELKQAVSRHNVQLPAQMDDKHEAVMHRLQNLRGAEFDREYMKAMVEAHQDARDLIGSKADSERAKGTTGTQTTRADDHDEALDVAVSQWATKTMPTVEHHLARAKEIRDKVGNTAGPTGTAGQADRPTTGTHHQEDGAKKY